MTTDGTIQPGEPSGATPETNPANEPPVWFREFQAKVEGRLSEVGKDFGRLREKLDGRRSPPPADPEKPVSSAPVTGANLADVLALGRITAGLPDEVRGEIDQLVSDGSFREARRLAEFAEKLAKSQPSATPGQTTVKVPTGHAATAAHSPAPGWPSKREYVELVRNRATDKAAAARLSALQDDPGFDPNSLK